MFKLTFELKSGDDKSLPFDINSLDPAYVILDKSPQIQGRLFR